MSGAAWHGFRGDKNWADPILVAECEEVNRADQGSSIKANEYMDSADVLEQKIELVAKMIKKSKCLVAYTGGLQHFFFPSFNYSTILSSSSAGLSRASGISDYASKAEKSVAKAPKIKNSLDAQPTYAHHVLTAMERGGYLKHYVQQNHGKVDTQSRNSTKKRGCYSL